MALRHYPWASWSEWMKAYHLLYSGLASRMAEGIAIVSLWRLRGHLPHAIDSTASLTELLIVQWEKLQSLTDEAPRQALSSAIVRFVDGIVDSGQRGNTAINIGAIAARGGLQRSFVDIRHQAVHGIMPPLRTLVKAAQQALDWLDERYWCVQYSLLQRAMESASLSITNITEGQIPQKLHPQDCFLWMIEPLTDFILQKGLSERIITTMKEISQLPGQSVFCTTLTASICAKGRPDLALRLLKHGIGSARHIRHLIPTTNDPVSEGLRQMAQSQMTQKTAEKHGIWSVIPAKDMSSEELLPLGMLTPVPFTKQEERPVEPSAGAPRFLTDNGAAQWWKDD